MTQREPDPATTLIETFKSAPDIFIGHIFPKLLHHKIQHELDSHDKLWTHEFCSPEPRQRLLRRRGAVNIDSRCECVQRLFRIALINKQCLVLVRDAIAWRMDVLREAARWRINEVHIMAMAWHQPNLQRECEDLGEIEPSLRCLGRIKLELDGGQRAAERGANTERVLES